MIVKKYRQYGDYLVLKQKNQRCYSSRKIEKLLKTNRAIIEILEKIRIKSSIVAKNLGKPRETNRETTKNDGKMRIIWIKFRETTLSKSFFGAIYEVFAGNPQNPRGNHRETTISPKNLEWFPKSPFGIYNNIPSGWGGPVEEILDDPYQYYTPIFV